MKIAFVGKGGSGKSTISGLFIRHLVESEQKVIAIDADINQHLASMIGAEFVAEKALDLHGADIRDHLVGDNQRVRATKRMIKTTPPGNGSGLVRISPDDKIIATYGTRFAPNGFFLQVGTYKEDGIGMSCYHSSLSVLENVLSHSHINQSDEWVVVDMVAGTDAFSGPLHAMFDCIYMIVEPTVESVAVFAQFAVLAERAGVRDRIKVIANKVEDPDDVAYIEDQTKQSIVTSVGYNKKLRQQRRDGAPISIADDVQRALTDVEYDARYNVIDSVRHLHKLHDLHRVFAAQQFTIDKYGDTLGHIDPDYAFEKEKFRG
ncbi:MAG TPA: ATP-binding protein [Candidatus Saccharibacteria bacterium]|nr:ATP-binding protein [Candidatus Saccharibacteria bacterium]